MTAVVSRPLLVVLAVLGTPMAAGAADVSGTFSVKGGGTIAPTYASAFETRDPRNPRQRVLEVVLSSAPIDVGRAVTALDPHTDVINQDALQRRDYILVWVRPDGHVSMNATFGASMTQFMDAVGDTLSAQVATNGPDRVAARLFTPKPVTTLDKQSYALDVTFNATVTRAPAGTPLPAGGGSAGKALVALDRAISTRNWAAIKAGLAPDTLKQLEEDYRSPKENLDYAVDVLRAWLPKKALVVTGGTLRGEVAVLDVEGQMFEGRRGLYVARMVRTGATWQLDRSVAAGMID